MPCTFTSSLYCGLFCSADPLSPRIRLLSLYYPYLVWSAISFLASAATGKATNNHYNWLTLVEIPVRPILHYWFLTSLMAGIALLYLLRTPATLIASAAAAPGASIFLPGWLHDTAYFFPFTVAGALFALRGSLPVLRPGVAILCLLFLIGGTYLAVVTGNSGLNVRSAPFVLISAAGCYVLLFFLQAIAAHTAGRALAFLGENSLVIYLLHVLVAASLRLLIYKIDPAFNPVAGVAICFAASLGLSLLAKQLSDAWGLSKLAGFEPILRDREFSRKPNPAAATAP